MAYFKNYAAKKIELVERVGEAEITKVNEGTEILTTSKKALRILNQKEMASRLGVSESMVSQWLNETKLIPVPRQYEILKQAKYFLKEQRGIEDNIDLLMMMQFGEAREE